MEKLEYYACPAEWAPQCYGCHAKQDVAKASGDWLNGKAGGDPGKQSFEVTARRPRSPGRVALLPALESPILGINSEGKVSPFVPGCQVILTQMDGEKNRLTITYTTVDGTNGLAHNPVQPHVNAKSRGCADCHMNRKTLGLGNGFYGVQDNFPDGEAPVDRSSNRHRASSCRQRTTRGHGRSARRSWSVSAAWAPASPVTKAIGSSWTAIRRTTTSTAAIRKLSKLKK